MSRPVAAVIGALAVAVVATVVIVAFGYTPVPAYPARIDPQAEGTVAFLRDECVFVVPGRGGEPRRLRCLEGVAPEPEGVRWRDDGSLVVRAYGSVPQEVVLDPRTGREIDRQPVREREPRSPEPSRRGDGTVAYAGARASLYVRAPGGSARLLIAPAGPRDYAFVAVSWSPDGRFLLVADTERRLLVVTAEGAPQPRLLVKDAEPAAAWGR